MKFRNTLILLVILLALGAYVILVEMKNPTPGSMPSTAAISTPMPIILSYNSAEVRALRLARSDQSQRTELVREEDGKWYLTFPTQEEADQGRVTRLVEGLAALRPQRVLTEDVGKPADYDLDPPAISVEIELQDKTILVLKLGAPNAARTAYYGQVAGDEHIYLLPYWISSDLEGALNAPPVKPTPTPAQTATTPPLLPPPPTGTPAR